MMTRQRWMFVLFAVLAVASAAFVWLGLPHDREVRSLGVLLLKLVPFVFAAEAIAWLDPAWVKRPRLVMAVIVLSFAVFFLYFVPKIFFYSDDFPNLYYYMLTLTPFIILALTGAYRLGGGGSGNSRRLAYAMLLIMLSGAEDLAFLTVNNHTDPRWTPIPEVWSWASHMTVFLGHPPHRTEAYAFIAVHLVLAVLILTVPGRWLQRAPVVRRLPVASRETA